MEPRNIILCGFMGTGKTRTGRALAARLGWTFFDCDDEIERRAGVSISEIFRTQGEAGFRAVESAVARDCAALERHVIATGGGMVLNSENVAALRAAGTLVLLTATPETIWQRVRHATHRPLLKKADPQGEIRRLLEERAGVYDAIELKVATDGRESEQVVQALLAITGAQARQG